MVATLAEIGFSIRDQVKGFFSVDDERIDIELVYKKIRDVRSVLIKNQLLERRMLDPALYQEICCLEIKCKEEVCNGKKTGVLEYYVDLPKIENTAGFNYSIKYFGSIDKLTAFNHKSFQGYQYGAASPYTGDKPFYTIIGSTAIIKNLPTTAAKYMCLVAILEDPLNGACYMATENDPYPLSNSMVHELELIVIKQLLSVLPVQPDERNDATDNPQGNNIARKT
ncbi:MAG: hypothetical protein ABIW84_01565 [Ilumatobacteraceae bacterium]